MKELIKKAVYNSIGIAAVTNEKFKELIEDLIQNNHFTQDEGKRITDSFLFDLRESIDTVNVSVQEKLDEFLQKMGVSRIQILKEDIETYINEVKNNPIILLKLPSKKYK